jgi:hypothetical protein
MLKPSMTMMMKSTMTMMTSNEVSQAREDVCAHSAQALSLALLSKH